VHLHLCTAAAVNLPRATDPAHRRHSVHVAMTTRCQATAAQRAKQVALETVVDKTVDDGIGTTVAVLAQHH